MAAGGRNSKTQSGFGRYAMSGLSSIPEVSRLLDEEMRNQLRDVLSKLNQDVWLISIVDTANEKCVELASLLKDIEKQGEKVHVELYAPGDMPELDKELIPEGRFPIVGIYNENKVFTGQSFLGVPGAGN